MGEMLLLLSKLTVSGNDKTENINNFERTLYPFIEETKK
jgi:hypothetical protein